MGSIEELQVDLNGFMDYYNYRRTHQGYKLKENGYNTPGRHIYPGPSMMGGIYQKA